MLPFQKCAFNQSVAICPIISGTDCTLNEKVLEKDLNDLRSHLNESNLWIKLVKFKI